MAAAAQFRSRSDPCLNVSSPVVAGITRLELELRIGVPVNLDCLESTRLGWFADDSIQNWLRGLRARSTMAHSSMDRGIDLK